MKDSPGVYVGRNLINNKVYVGSSKRAKRRVDDHIRKLTTGAHHNKSLQSSWNTHGKEAFVWEVVEYCPEKLRFIREQWWINHLKALNRRYGFNFADPVDVSVFWTDKQRQRQSAHAKMQWQMLSDEKKQAARENLDAGRIAVNAQWFDPNSKVRKVRQENLAKGSEALAKLLKDPVWKKGRKTGSRTAELWQDEEYRNRMLMATEEGRKKGQARFVEIVKSPEFKAEHSERNLHLWQDPTYRDQQNKSRKKVWQDPDYKLKQSEARRSAWNDPVKRAARLEKSMLTRQSRNKVKI